MIYSLRGKIVEKNQHNTVIDVHDVCYEFLYCSFIPLSLEEEKLVFIHEENNENEHYLVGFSSTKEKQLFILLISIKGIGIKTALALFTSYPLDELISILENQEISKLVSIQGIGRTSAAILVASYPFLISRHSKEKLSNNKEEVKKALVSLGYKENEFMMYLTTVDEDSSENILKSILEKLAKKNRRGLDGKNREY